MALLNASVMSLVGYAAIAVALWFATTVVYRRTLHPLAKVPGPFLPAVTGLYAWYWNVPKQGLLYKRIEELHDKYGPIVRITPNEIHLSNPENYDKIYTVGSKFYKDPTFYQALGIDVATFATVPNDLHRRRRAALSPFFSRRKVLEMEDVVQEKVSKLCRRVQEANDAEKPIDLHSAFRAVSVDVITDYGFNHCYNSLDAEDFGSWFSDMVRDSAAMFFTFAQWPFLRDPMQKGIPDWIARRMSPSVGLFLDTVQKTRNQVVQVQRQIDAGIKPKRTTIFHQLMDPNATEGHVVPTVDDLADESFAVCTAAADTTGNAMTVAAYHVVKNSKIYETLKKELAEHFPDPTAEMKWSDLEKLPYLTGVVKEGQRLSFGVISRLPRAVPEGGATFEGYYVPPGAAVSMSSWMMHRNPTAFPSPDTFDPTRWMDPSVAGLREKCLVPFSRGSRMCLGMNLAQCELYCTLGILFRRFPNLEAYDIGPEDMVYEEYFSAFHPPSARKFKVVVGKE